MNDEEKNTNEPIEPVNNPFANMHRKENEMDKQKKKNKMTVIIAGVIIGLLLIYIIIDMVGDMVRGTPANPEPKENLSEVAVDLQTFINDYDLDALDAYGRNEINRVAINHICSGVYDCKNVSSAEVSNYIKTVFNKNALLADVNCEINDGVLYRYDAASERFVYENNHPKHKKTNVVPALTKVNSIKKKNNKYILVLNKLYYDRNTSEYITSDPLGIHKIYEFEDYDMTSDSGQVLDITKLKSDYENEFSKLKNKGTRYEYTFVKDGKRYYLEKYVTIEES